MYNLHHAHEKPQPVYSFTDEELDRELTDEELFDAERGYPWVPEPESFEDFSFLEDRQKKALIIPAILPTQFTEWAFRMPRSDGLGYAPFTFNGRRHMKKVYDTPAKRILLFCGRQVEKCVYIRTNITRADGSVVEAGEVRVGDVLPCLDTKSGPGAHMTTAAVRWVSHIQSKPCLRIRTRQGHQLEVSTTHPVRTWEAWRPAGALAVGDRVASVRRAGLFGAVSIPTERLELTAFMVGDGGTTQRTYTFTNKTPQVMERFEWLLHAVGHTARMNLRKGTPQYRIHRNGPLYDWLRQDHLDRKYSYEKSLPLWVFQLNRADTALFLNRLWATDGHTKHEGGGKCGLEYCSTSRLLAQQVQSLLWKFGIPTSRRENQPVYICTDGEPAKLAHILRIETQDAVSHFLQHIGALGKSEGISLPAVTQNNKRDTYPREVNGLLRRIIQSNPRPRSGRRAKLGSLRSAGLRETLKYPPSRRKLLEYVVFFRADGAYDARLVEELSAHLDTDVYWDEIESIEEMGEQPCVDFEVEDQHNFVVDGVVTHNSTLLGNRIITYSCMVQGFRTLYVSPSSTQTKTFSGDRIKEPLETSDVLRQFTTTLLQQNVFEKQFVNRSKITLRYAFLNADRCAVGETRVHFTDGAVATLAEIRATPLAFIGRWVWSADRDALSQVPALLEDVVDQGVRSVLRVRLEGGAQTTCTANQPLLTWEGWKQVQELHVGDLVAVPRSAAHGVGNALLVEEYRLVGYLLGDGCLTTFNGVAFFGGEARVMQEFQRCARVLGAKLGALTDSNRPHWIHSETKRQGIYGGTGGYKKRLKELGLVGKNHATKRVPSAFFTGNAQQLAGLLGAIYATDGWASISNKKQFEIGYGSNSLGLLQDLKVLLLRFGVTAWVSRQKKPSTENAQGAYVLSIRAAASVANFCEKIPVLGKEDAFAKVYRLARTVSRKKDDADRIPLSYPDLRAYLLRAHGLSAHTAWMRYRIQLRPGNTRDSIGRRVLAEIAKKLGDAYLTRLAASELGWARIDSIEDAGTAETYDLTVSGTENYLVDGLFIHNTRGIPAWMLAIDELQDVLADNIPVIEQSTSHAPETWRRFLYAGTPKGLDNTIEYYRSGTSKGKPMSTMGEWVVPCDRCGSSGGAGRYWNVLGEKNIQRKGLSCERCSQLIDPMHPDAQWAAMQENGIFEAYRIPQLMVPWRPWEEIMLDYGRYDRAKFYNEVLGVSYDSGLRPLTRAQVRDACSPLVSMHPDKLEFYKNHGVGQPIFMGVDWGTGENSYTVMTLATYVNSKFRVFYVHRFTGEDVDPEPQLEKISQMVQYFNVRVIGTDYGGGFHPNDFLTRKFGPKRVQKFQYLSRGKKKLAYNPMFGRWQIVRTEVMSDLFNAIKRKQLELPRWEEFEDPHGNDLLNIFSEYNNTLRMIQYTHRPDRPDDTFHSILYCLLASMIVHPRPDIIIPRKERPGVGPMQTGYSGPIDQG